MKEYDKVINNMKIMEIMKKNENITNNGKRERRRSRSKR